MNVEAKLFVPIDGTSTEKSFQILLRNVRNFDGMDFNYRCVKQVAKRNKAVV